MSDCLLLIETAPSDGMVRLIEGNSTDSGYVMVAYNGYWGAICAQFWDDRDAHVCCKMLGYQSGNAYHMAKTFERQNKQLHMTVVISKIFCNGTENNLDDCTHDKVSTTLCKNDIYAAAHCYRNSIDYLDQGNDTIDDIFW